MNKDEALKLALEALESADWYIGQLEFFVYPTDETNKTHEEHAKVKQAITAINEALAQPAPVQEPTDIAALVEGMEVSIDVSTGEHDAGHRLFGTVTLAQENRGSKHGLILLVQEPTSNFKVPPPAAQPAPAQEPVYLVQDDFGMFRVTNKDDFSYWSDPGRNRKTLIAGLPFTTAPVGGADGC